MKVANILSDMVSLPKGILSTGLLLVSEYDQTESLPFDISVLLLEGVKKGKVDKRKLFLHTLQATLCTLPGRMSLGTVRSLLFYFHY